MTQMLTEVNPKLPMRDIKLTKEFYLTGLNFTEIADHGDYLLIKKDAVEIHFFLFKNLKPRKNYGQVYIRTNNIEELYESIRKNGIKIHPNAPLEIKPWGQKEFALLDPDYNLITFGESL